MAQDIRIYEVQNMLEKKLNNMTQEELLGAEEVITCLFSYLNRLHFKEQKQLDVKAFTKTIEELKEISMQILDNKFHNKK